MQDKVLKVVPKYMEVVQPTVGGLSAEQRQKAIHNLLKFSATPALAFLVGLRSGLSVQQAFGLSLIPALINSLIDVITKWNDATPYLREK